MKQTVGLNLPVRNLAKATDFYLGLGYTKHEQFSDETTSAIVISDHLLFFLQTTEKLEQFFGRPVAVPSEKLWGTIALASESHEAVDALVDKSLELGATRNKDAEDYGFMYSCDFLDLDGNLLQHVWINPDGFPSE